MPRFHLNDQVRLYDNGSWFTEGNIVLISHGKVNVDYGDWIQQYNFEELKKTSEFFQDFWIPLANGVLLERF